MVALKSMFLTVILNEVKDLAVGNNENSARSARERTSGQHDTDFQ